MHRQPYSKFSIILNNFSPFIIRSSKVPNMAQEKLKHLSQFYVTNIKYYLNKKQHYIFNCSKERYLEAILNVFLSHPTYRLSTHLSALPQQFFLFKCPHSIVLATLFSSTYIVSFQLFFLIPSLLHNKQNDSLKIHAMDCINPLLKKCNISWNKSQILLNQLKVHTIGQIPE